MQTIAIAMHKGGQAKTVTALHVCVYLAERGVRVLGVDLDQQTHLTRYALTPEAFEDLKIDIVPALAENVPLADLVVPTRWERFDLAPSSQNMGALDQLLAVLPRREDRLRRALQGVADRYDVAVLDCPPSAGLVVQNALAASDWILVTVTPGNFSMAGLSDFWTWAEYYRREGVHDAKWLGILPTNVEDRLRITKATREILNAAPMDVLGAVPKRVGVEDLITARVPASDEWLPEIAQAYRLTVEHVMKTMGLKEPAGA
jgi:chromosome partitioning protein